MDGSWETTTGLTREEFEKFTRYCQADNPIDNNNRAKMLGFDAEKVQIAPGAILRQPKRITIGKNVFIGLFTYLNGEVIIGENVLIGPHCSLSANNHVFSPKKKCFGGGQQAPIVIRDGAWLSAGCQVTAGATVGRGTLVCANATVTQDTPEFAIMAGIPARQVGHIDVETGEQVWHHKMLE
ncbi:MAG: acyltransferase [Candidatus Latescibacteria bacterium]|nr:acyltransferase [Candidatus Latescibacterota bacterium]